MKKYTEIECWQIQWRDSAELAELFRKLLERANAAMRSGPLQSKIAFALKETSAKSAVDRKVLKDNPTLGVRKWASKHIAMGLLSKHMPQRVSDDLSPAEIMRLSRTVRGDKRD